MTNNGAMLAVDTAGRRVEWALTYDPPPILTGYMMFGGYMPRQQVKSPGAIVIRGSTLYLKEQDGYALFAVDLGGSSLKWKRPVDPSATIADVDDQYVYTMGEELSAIDLNSRQMKWSTKVPVGTGSLRVIRAGESFYVLSTRGVFEIRADTGDPGPRVFRTADKDALGGRLWRAPDRLITVSNQAVTAYSLAAQ
jgi:outer membrane protein assembly factor BamB